MDGPGMYTSMPELLSDSSTSSSSTPYDEPQPPKQSDRILDNIIHGPAAGKAPMDGAFDSMKSAVLAFNSAPMPS